MIELSDFLQPSNMLDLEYRGIVVENDDPRRLGRVKVQIDGLFEATDTTVLPWVAQRAPMMFGGAPFMSGMVVPEIGAELTIVFPFRDEYFPFYTGYWQSDETVNGRFNDGYPDSYGFGDSQGTSVKVNKARGDIEFIHQSGMQANINPDGELEVRTPAKVRFVSLDGQTEFVFDMVTGSVSLSPKSDFVIAGDVHRVTASSLVHDVGEVIETISGGDTKQIFGGRSHTIGGDDSQSVLGNFVASIAGDHSKLVAGSTSKVYGTGYEADVVLGDHVIAITAGNLHHHTQVGSCIVENNLAGLTIDATGDIKLATALGAGLHISPLGLIGLGSNIAELLDLFDQTLTGIISLNVGTGVGPSTPPLNVAIFIAIKTLLAFIKGSAP